MSNTQILEHQISGDLSSKTLLVFLQGWPDSLDMWEYYMGVSNELKDFKILKINFPNYGKEKIAWGQDFPIIQSRLKATIDSVTGVDKRVLVCHDWGCIYGYLVDEVPASFIVGIPKVFQPDRFPRYSSQTRTDLPRENLCFALPGLSCHCFPDRGQNW